MFGRDKNKVKIKCIDCGKKYEPNTILVIEEEQFRVFSCPECAAGFIILMIGAIIVIGAFRTSLLFAGQYFILAVIIMAIGGYIMAKGNHLLKEVGQ